MDMNEITAQSARRLEDYAGLVAYHAISGRTDPDTGEFTHWSSPADLLGSVVAARSEIEHLQRCAVHAARERGASWSQIGQAFGITRQAAQQRFALTE